MAASREFICVRPQTYEDASESKVLASILSGRGALENTVFALLDPSGHALTRGSRSPRMMYGSVDRFVAALQKTAARYRKHAKPIEALPAIKDLRLALNVAAADLRPLVIVRGKDAAAADKLAAKVAEAAWSELSVGRLHYVVLAGKHTYEGLTPKLGVTVVQPETYGRGGEVLAHASSSASAKQLSKQLVNGLCAHDVSDKDYERHVQRGRRNRIWWEYGDPDSKGQDPGDRRRRRR